MLFGWVGRFVQGALLSKGKLPEPENRDTGIGAGRRRAGNLEGHILREYSDSHPQRLQQRLSVQQYESLPCGGKFRVGPVQRGDVVVQRLLQQLRPRHHLRNHCNLYGCNRMVQPWRRMEAMRRLLPQCRFMDSGVPVLQQRRHLDSRMSERRDAYELGYDH